MTEYQSCDNCEHSQKKESEKPCSECEYINKEQIFTKWESSKFPKLSYETFKIYLQMTGVIKREYK